MTGCAGGNEPGPRDALPPGPPAPPPDAPAPPPDGPPSSGLPAASPAQSGGTATDGAPSSGLPAASPAQSGGTAADGAPSSGLPAASPAQSGGTATDGPAGASGAGPLRRVIRIVNPLGLHFRIADRFAKQAKQYACAVTVWNGDARADGKSMTDLILLVALPEAEVVLEVDGPDAAGALAALAEVLAAPGGEDYRI